MIIEDVRSCSHCKEDTILIERETAYTSDLSRPDLYGEITNIAHINEDGSITTRPGRAFCKQINVYVEPHLPDSKVNNVLRLEQRQGQGDTYDLYATCPNCGESIGLYTGIPNSVKALNQPYHIEVIPFDILPKRALVFSSRPVDGEEAEAP